MFAGAAVVGAALLGASEFRPLYKVVVGTLEITRRQIDGADNHSYALLVIAALALVMALGALRRSRPAALALVALGAAALLITITIDLPDARATGRLPESVSFEDAKAKPADGLYLAAAGGALVTVSGIALLTTALPGRSSSESPREGRARAGRSRPRRRDRSPDEP